MKRQPDVLLGNEKHDIVDMTAVSCHKIILSSKNRKKVVLVDTITDTVLSDIVLKAQPRFICMTGSQQAATTLDNNKIQFIKVNDTLLIDDSILDVDVDVFGIAPHNNNIVVSYSAPPGVQIISKIGTVIHKIDNTTAGREMFNKPRYIATTSDGSIYVTDWETNKIIRLDATLTILHTFAWPILGRPHGIFSMNRDQLLVCNKQKNNIVLIEPSKSSMTVILVKQHGVEKPCSICFCMEQKKLYVAPYNVTSSILVYKLP